MKCPVPEPLRPAPSPPSPPLQGGWLSGPLRADQAALRRALQRPMLLLLLCLAWQEAVSEVQFPPDFALLSHRPPSFLRLTAPALNARGYADGKTVRERQFPVKCDRARIRVVQHPTFFGPCGLGCSLRRLMAVLHRTWQTGQSLVLPPQATWRWEWTPTHFACPAAGGHVALSCLFAETTSCRTWVAHHRKARNGRRETGTWEGINRALTAAAPPETSALRFLLRPNGRFQGCLAQEYHRFWGGSGRPGAVSSPASVIAVHLRMGDKLTEAAMPSVRLYVDQVPLVHVCGVARPGVGRRCATDGCCRSRSESFLAWPGTCDAEAGGGGGGSAESDTTRGSCTPPPQQFPHQQKTLWGAGSALLSPGAACSARCARDMPPAGLGLTNVVC